MILLSHASVEGFKQVPIISSWMIPNCQCDHCEMKILKVPKIVCRNMKEIWDCTFLFIFQDLCSYKFWTNCFVMLWTEMMSPDEMSKKVFKEMDINHDSKITKEEFIQVCLKNYTISETLARKFLQVISTDV